MPKLLRIERLADEFAEYMLYLKCAACAHERRTTPHALARVCGWNARLDDVIKRLRCSACGKKQCSARAEPLAKPRSYRSDRN